MRKYCDRFQKWIPFQNSHLFFVFTRKKHVNYISIALLWVECWRLKVENKTRRSLEDGCFLTLWSTRCSLANIWPPLRPRAQTDEPFRSGEKAGAGRLFLRQVPGLRIARPLHQSHLYFTNRVFQEEHSSRAQLGETFCQRERRSLSWGRVKMFEGFIININCRYLLCKVLCKRSLVLANLFTFQLISYCHCATASQGTSWRRKYRFGIAFSGQQVLLGVYGWHAEPCFQHYRPTHKVNTNFG